MCFVPVVSLPEAIRADRCSRARQPVGGVTEPLFGLLCELLI